MGGRRFPHVKLPTGSTGRARPGRAGGYLPRRMRCAATGCDEPATRRRGREWVCGEHDAADVDVATPLIHDEPRHA